MEGGQTPTHFLQSILSAPVPLPHLPPPPTPLAKSNFGPNAVPAAERLAKI